MFDFPAQIYHKSLAASKLCIFCISFADGCLTLNTGVTFDQATQHWEQMCNGTEMHLSSKVWIPDFVALNVFGSLGYSVIDSGVLLKFYWMTGTGFAAPVFQQRTTQSVLLPSAIKNNCSALQIQTWRWTICDTINWCYFRWHREGRDVSFHYSRAS